MRVAVVGATGVYGRNLVPLLVHAGFRMRALVRAPAKAHALFGDQIEAVECDLLADDIAARLPAMLAHCDAVLHIATAIPADAAAPNAWEANTRLRTEGTQALLNATLAVGVECYIQQSIVMAYPDCGDEWIDERTPLQQTSVGSPVSAMEAMVRDIATERLRTCILRGGAFVGASTFQECTIARLKAGHELILCDGRYFVSYVHVADIARATVAALQRAPAGSIFNIVDEPLRQRDYLERLAALVGAPPPTFQPNAPCPPSQRCSNRLAREMLQWQPIHSILPQIETRGNA